jgi:hypothetical protein
VSDKATSSLAQATPDTGDYIYGVIGANSRKIQIGTLATSTFGDYNVDGDLTQTRVGGLWTDSPNFKSTPVTGVNVARLERLFVGDAADNDGTKLGQGDWLEQTARFTTSNSELAVVANSGRNAFVAAVRSSDNNEAGDDNIAASFYVFNDNASFVQDGYGIYVEVVRESNSVGAVLGMEIDPTSHGTSQDVLPYTSSYSTMSNALWLASGGGDTGVTDASLAIGIVNNNAKFKQGIVFGDDSLTGTDGVTGTGQAVVLAKGHKIDWYYAGNNLGLSLYSDVASSTDKQTVLADSNGTSFLNNSDLANARVAKVAGTVTGGLDLVGSTSGTPEIQGFGSATDVNVGVRPKGAGVAYTTSAFGAGTSAPDRRLHTEIDDASNSSVTQLLRITHTTSGSPAAGIGVGMEFEVETSAGNNEIAATIEAIATDVTGASEDFNLVFRTMEAGGAAGESLRLIGGGTQPSVAVGANASGQNAYFGIQSRFIAHGTGGFRAFSAARWTADASGCFLDIGKSRGTSVGSFTVVQANDAIGQIGFYGADGTDFAQAASIAAAVDGTPGDNDMPGRITFSTSADGSASPTERMRIDSAGVVIFQTDRGARFNNQTSAAGASTGTLTNAPAAGNPGHWLKINVGGTNYAIPCWAG